MYKSEGSSTPFVARLLLGTMELRDSVIGFLISSNAEREPRRMEFDNLYFPGVFNSMLAMRKSMEDIRTAIVLHKQNVDSGACVRIHGKSVHILASISQEVQSAFGQFLTSAVRSMRSMQKVTLLFNLDIGGFFMKEKNFEKRMMALEYGGHSVLVQYLRRSRTWSTRLHYRRDSLEHDSWSLERIKYPRGRDGSVHMEEPTIDDQLLSDWVFTYCAHVLAFVEDVLVYAFQQRLRAPIAIFEIPLADRDPDCARRFRISLASMETLSPWVPHYDPAGFE